ncbi:MAG: Tol-Pal system protein TolB, partial [Pseudomonadota bacterium]
MIRLFMCLLAALTVLSMPARAQDGPLRIEITEGVIEPLPYAVPAFVPGNAAADQLSANIAQVIASDLNGTGLFRQIPDAAHISRVTSFSSPVQFSDWKAINAQALIVGAVDVDGSGRVTARFRLFDVFAGQELGQGLQLVGTTDGWRRIAHKVADQVYSRLTGESGYFDSRVVFVSETGPKGARQKRLAIMDYDGANVTFLTD